MNIKKLIEALQDVEKKSGFCDVVVSHIDTWGSTFSPHSPRLGINGVKIDEKNNRIVIDCNT